MMRRRRVQPPAPYHRFTVNVFGTPIDTIVTTSPQEVDRIIRSLIPPNNEGQRQVVGLALEIEYRYGRDHPLLQAVATIQLCCGQTCLIYYMLGEAFFPPALRQFLFNPDVTFVGFGLTAQRLGILTRDAEFERDVPCLSLRELARENYSVFPDLSFLAMVFLYSVNIQRPQPPVRWDYEDLSDRHVQYACSVAYVSLSIGNLIMTMSSAAAGNLPQLIYYGVNEKDDAIEQVHEVQIFGRRIATTVTKRLEAVEQWIADVMHDRNFNHYVGFDIKLTKVHNLETIGTVQFCVGSRCLIIQFYRMIGRYLPNLEHFLLRNNNVFMGVGQGWKMRLFKDRLVFARDGTVRVDDLRIYAGRGFLETDVRKDPEWSRAWLSDAQVEHSCITAALSYELGILMSPPRA